MAMKKNIIALVLLNTLFPGLLCGAETLTGVPVAADRIDQLGGRLTPLGGETAGNADGTIPAWRGGLVEPPAGYIEGRHYIDPYAQDPVIFTVTAANMRQHAGRLTAGHQALLRTYPDSFKMKIYPSRRSASAPQYIYDATRKNAATARLTPDGNGVEQAVIGIPFPIPSNGLQVIWNHILRWRAGHVARHIAQAIPTVAGDYSLIEFLDRLSFHYSQPQTDLQTLDNIILFFIQEIKAPARAAGGIILLHETLNQKAEHRKAWLYNPGPRNIRRLPGIGFDNPGTLTDGMRTNDQFDMYNGSPELYRWRLEGKKELYVPYNNYRLQQAGVKYDDILKPRHINPDLPRYELHRVWVVDARLKPGAGHIYARRTFYIDEDSWQILAVDQYDSHNRLWRVSEGFAINYYNVPSLWTTLEVHTDLRQGRYLAIGLNSESRPYDFSVNYTAKDFSPAALRRLGKR